MKAADYRIPWGRPSEHLLAVKREIIGQQLHVRRVQDARNRSTIDTEPPECAHMPHLISRPKKKKVRCGAAYGTGSNTTTPYTAGDRAHEMCGYLTTDGTFLFIFVCLSCIHWYSSRSDRDGTPYSKAL